MKGFILTIIYAAFFTVNFPLIAQEAEEEQPEYGWKNEIVGALNLTQASFSNWKQGGENALAWQIELNTNFKLEQEKYFWNNTGKIAFGFAKVGDIEARKSTDEINFESVLTRKLSKFLNPFVSVTAKTQFAAGFEYEGDTKTQVSKFLDPGYFTQSLGIGYTPNEAFETRLGATVKETITSDFPAPYADDPATTAKIEKTKVEPGISSVTNYKVKFEENVLFDSKLDMFSDLEAFNRIDVLWENNLTLKVSKFINVNVNFDIFYDRDISDKRQIKQALAVGFAYTFL